ncbi:MAG: tetratricopeptide repeat protein, partial [Thermomicrobiales bacterium]
ESEFAGAIGCHYFHANDERAIAWLVQAAEQAQSVYEPATTIDYATKAIEFALRVGAEPPVEAYCLRGHAHDVLGDYDAARTDLRTVLEISRNNGDPLKEWDALIDLGALWAESDYSRSGPLYQSALELAQALGDDRKIAHSLNRVGNWRINVGDPKTAREAHQQALEIFDRLGDANGRAETLDLAGLASYLSGDFVASARYSRQAIDMFRQSGNDRHLASSLSLLALSGGGLDQETSPSARGTPGEWLDHANEALEIARKIGWRAGEAFALIVAGAAYADHGRPGDGIARLERARDYAVRIGHHQWSVAATSDLGITLANVLQWEEARDLLLEALAMARELGSEYWTRTTASHLMVTHIALGDLDAAAVVLDEAFSVDDSIDSLGQRKLWFGAAHLALARGNSQEALAIADRLLETAPGRADDEVVPDLALLRGRALLASGNGRAAIPELTAAGRIAGEGRDPLTLWRLRAVLAAIARESGDEVSATKELDLARQTIESIALQLDANERGRIFRQRAANYLEAAL